MSKTQARSARDPVFFVVERWGGRKTGALIHDTLPGKYRTRAAKENGLEYSRRIDDQPHLRDRSPAELYDIWELLGELPGKDKIPAP